MSTVNIEKKHILSAPIAIASNGNAITNVPGNDSPSTLSPTDSITGERFSSSSSISNMDTITTFSGSDMRISPPRMTDLSVNSDTENYSDASSDTSSSIHSVGDNEDSKYDKATIEIDRLAGVVSYACNGSIKPEKTYKARVIMPRLPIDYTNSTKPLNLFILVSSQGNKALRPDEKLFHAANGGSRPENVAYLSILRSLAIDPRVGAITLVLTDSPYVRCNKVINTAAPELTEFSQAAWEETFSGVQKAAAMLKSWLPDNIQKASDFQIEQDLRKSLSEQEKSNLSDPEYLTKAIKQERARRKNFRLDITSNSGMDLLLPENAKKTIAEISAPFYKLFESLFQTSSSLPTAVQIARLRISQYFITPQKESTKNSAQGRKALMRQILDTCRVNFAEEYSALISALEKVPSFNEALTDVSTHEKLNIFCSSLLDSTHPWVVARFSDYMSRKESSSLETTGRRAKAKKSEQPDEGTASSGNECQKRRLLNNVYNNIKNELEKPQEQISTENVPYFSVLLALIHGSWAYEIDEFLNLGLCIPASSTHLNTIFYPGGAPRPIRAPIEAMITRFIRTANNMPPATPWASGKIAIDENAFTAEINSQLAEQVRGNLLSSTTTTSNVQNMPTVADKRERSATTGAFFAPAKHQQGDRPSTYPPAKHQQSDRPVTTFDVVAQLDSLTPIEAQFLVRWAAKNNIQSLGEDAVNAFGLLCAVVKSKKSNTSSLAATSASGVDGCVVAPNAASSTSNVTTTPDEQDNSTSYRN